MSWEDRELARLVNSGVGIPFVLASGTRFRRVVHQLGLRERVHLYPNYDYARRAWRLEVVFELRRLIYPSDWQGPVEQHQQGPPETPGYISTYFEYHEVERLYRPSFIWQPCGS